MTHKLKLSYLEQIDHLKKKGIQFQYFTESDAVIYLKENNNFFKLLSFRKNFNKDIKNNLYLHLDFAYLVDLAILDMYLRSIIIQMSLNIEHFAKVKLIKLITEDPNEDGYSIVTDYTKELSSESISKLNLELERNAKSPYCCKAYKKYKNDLPVWVFLEIITFGSFLSFYKFAIDRFKLKWTKKECKEHMDNFYLMLSVKHIRNAAAHNNCILNDLKEKALDTRRKANWKMIRAMNKVGLSSTVVDNKLSNERIQEIITCLWAHKQIISSRGLNHHVAELLHHWSARVYRDFDYSFNLLLKTTFDTLSTLIDNWFPIV